MRKFSEVEKKFIRALIAGSESAPHSNFPINVLDPLFMANRMRFDASNQYSFNSQGTLIQNSPTLTFLVANQNQINLNAIQNIKQRLYELALLLEYLTKEGLLYKIQIPNHSNTYFYDPYGITPGPTTAVLQLESCISDFLVSCINEPVYVGETLKALSKNNFVSIEEQALEEAKKQTKTSLRSLRIAIIALLVAILSVVATSIASVFAPEIKNFISKKTNTHLCISKLDKQEKTIEIKVNDVVLKANVYRDSIVVSKEITVLRNRLSRAIPKK